MTVSINCRDILAVQSGVICQQVNCKGVMGAGLARATREKFPMVYRDYRDAYHRGELKLGHVIFSKIQENPFFCFALLCGQDGYGKEGRYTDYAALELCLLKVARYVVNITAQRTIDWAQYDPPKIFIPYRMGCGLGGGNWSLVLQLLHDTLPNVTICRR